MPAPVESQQPRRYPSRPPPPRTIHLSYRTYPCPSFEEALRDLKLATTSIFQFDHGHESLANQIRGRLHDYIDHAARTTPEANYFAFLTARMQHDFALARRAITTAVENEAGIPCLWFDDDRIASDVPSVRQRTRFIIRDAQMVIADITFGLENPEADNPNRAHEIGLAEAYDKLLLLTCQEPRRDPYFLAIDKDIQFWEEEKKLHDQVVQWIRSNRAELSRRIFNYELNSLDEQDSLNIRPTEFTMDNAQRYIAPNAYPLSDTESWLVAAGFACIALSLSLLVERFIGFSDSFDFAAILAAIFTLVFSSSLHTKIRQRIGQIQYLRWLIPIIGLILLLFWVLFRSDSGGQP